MRFRSKIMQVTGVIAALSVGSGVGCGDGNSEDPSNAGGQSQDVESTAEDTSSVSLSLITVPSGEYRELNMDLQKVDVQDPQSGQWHPIATPDKMVNLLGAITQNQIGQSAQIPRRHYRKMRLTVGNQANLRLLDGTVQKLVIPQQLKTGMVFDVDMDLQRARQAKLSLDFDAARSVQIIRNRGLSSYHLRPMVQAVDQAKTGYISGTLTDRLTGKILHGARVYAQAYNVKGQPFIQRSALTDQFGRYTLGTLPFGRDYYVVSRPNVQGIMYAAQASAPFNLKQQSRSAMYNMAFEQVTAQGQVSGQLTPTMQASECDRVELLQNLPVSDMGSKSLIVDTAQAVLAEQENYSFANLAAGTYAVQSRRQKLGADGVNQWSQYSVTKSFDLAAGQNTQQDLTVNTNQ
jgi:hypothetical protein